MENQKNIELSLSDFLKKEGVDNIRDDETFCVAEYEAVRDYCLQKEFLLSSKDLLEIKSRRLEYSYDMWKEHFQEEKKDRLIKFLLNQDLSETESEEVLNNFVESINEKDLHVVAIFESFTDLANNYVDNVVGDLDHHIAAVLDYTALGRQIADSCEEYMALSSGRIIEFEL